MLKKTCDQSVTMEVKNKHHAAVTECYVIAESSAVSSLCITSKTVFVIALVKALFSLQKY